MAVDLGYTKEEFTQAPEGANMGLGCGNPIALASLKPGEMVLDLGSGGGFDCFLAARAVGETGKVIGVDMTPEMVSKVRETARKEGIKNVEFRLGEIEHLPVSDESIDVIISNCVINLSPAKERVLREAFRVLRAGGRLAVSDIVATSPLSEEVRKDLSLISACVGGAEGVESLKKLLEETGFTDVKVEVVKGSENFIAKWFPGKGFEGSIASARIEAVKPLGTGKIKEGPKADPDESKQIRKTVYAHYQSGLHCAEVISKTLLETFSGKAKPEVIKAASGFGGGIAGSTEELCGALTGGIIAIGALLGRENPGDDLRDCGGLTNKFKKQFLSQFGSLKCRDILDGFSEKESHIGCVKLTAEASVILGRLVKEFERTKGVRLVGKTDLQREKVELGRCPFTPKACSCS
jgi:C_GCAxxG_C_C family probable redox protein